MTIKEFIEWKFRVLYYKLVWLKIIKPKYDPNFGSYGGFWV